MTDRKSPSIKAAATTDPLLSAKEAGLRYVSDATPGIRRVRHGKSFAYVDTNNRPVRDEETLARIKSLVIPPAWRDVWICPIPNGHLQATGRDDRGRKQHRYHPRWREVRDQTKYDKMIAFAKVLPTIHRVTNQHLKLPGLPREKVLATVVQLLEKTLIRVGNEEYARTNEHFGLTTLRDKHVRFKGSGAAPAAVHFEFRGKSGVERALDLHDKRLAKIIRDCQELPGYDLFQYIDETGVQRDVTSQDVNDYLREITAKGGAPGQDFTAKDFRTWAGTVLAARALREFEPATSERQAKKNIVQAVESVSKMLGNTRAVCRKCYIHPAILNAYLDGSLVQTVQRRAAEVKSKIQLTGEESAVLSFLQKRLKRAPTR
jgi:DNA topoisomerase-1